MNDDKYTPEELAVFQALADEAEAGYSVEELSRRGRPRLGPAAHSVVISVRLTPGVAAALEALAVTRHQTRSEVARDVLESSLAQG